MVQRARRPEDAGVQRCQIVVAQVEPLQSLQAAQGVVAHQLNLIVLLVSRKKKREPPLVDSDNNNNKNNNNNSSNNKDEKTGLERTLRLSRSRLGVCWKVASPTMLS